MQVGLRQVDGGALAVVGSAGAGKGVVAAGADIAIRLECWWGDGGLSCRQRGLRWWFVAAGAG